MKENMLDLLIYLFENYLEDGSALGNDRETVRSQLMGEGFRATTNDRAFTWLEGLVPQPGSLALASNPPGRTFRIYTAEEQDCLSPACQGFLFGLEQAGVVDVKTREMIIEQALALDSDELDIDQLKWVAQLVLSNHPEVEEDPVTWTDGVMIYPVSEFLH